jgi:hypothetical protein
VEVEGWEWGRREARTILAVTVSPRRKRVRDSVICATGAPARVMLNLFGALLAGPWLEGAGRFETRIARSIRLRVGWRREILVGGTADSSIEPAEECRLRERSRRLSMKVRNASASASFVGWVCV